jgi:hypothetical protein
MTQPQLASLQARLWSTPCQRWLTIALAVWGLGLAVLAGSEGSPGWRILRIVSVVFITVAALLISVR